MSVAYAMALAQARGQEGPGAQVSVPKRARRWVAAPGRRGAQTSTQRLEGLGRRPD